MKGRILITLALLLALTACEKEFYPGGATGTQMTINSLFNSGSPIVVYLTPSYASSDANNNVTPISDAQIALYEDSIFKEYLHYVPSDTQNAFGAYFSNLIPQNGKTYSITASEAKYPTATASDQIPQPAQIIACNFVQFPKTGTGNMKVNLVFQDNPAVENYYRLNTWLSGTTFSVDSNNDTTYASFLTAIEPYVLGGVNDTVRDDPKFLLFSDRGFNGQIKELQIQGSIHSLRSNVVNANLLIELHTVSKSHYEYFRTYQIYRVGDGSTTTAGYVYSNVTNGYGIFVGENWKENIFVIR